MKNFIKLYWLTAVVILVLSLVTLNKCSTKQNNEVQQDINTSNLRAYLIDSTKTAANVAKIAEIEAVKALEGKKATLYKYEAIKYKNAAEKQKHISDSLQNLIPKTDTTCQKVVASKQAEIDTLNIVCDNLDREAESYSRQLNMCEQQSSIKDTTLAITKNELKILSDNTIKAQKASEKKDKVNKITWFFAKVIILLETVMLISK